MSHLKELEQAIIDTLDSPGRWRVGECSFMDTVSDITIHLNGSVYYIVDLRLSSDFAGKFNTWLWKQRITEDNEKASHLLYRFRHGLKQ